MRSYLNDPEAPDVEIVSRGSDYFGGFVYRYLLPRMVMPCVDIVPILRVDSGFDPAFWLAERAVYPQKGVWCLGGRLFFNDKTIEDAAVRVFRREVRFKKITVELNPDLLMPICVALCPWAKTKQGGFGKSLSVMLGYAFSQEEIDEIGYSLNPREYKPGLKRYNRIELIKNNVHPAMRDAHGDFFPLQPHETQVLTKSLETSHVA